MKILLLGEYSNVHWTLAQALRQLGHEVTVVSNGDEWKAYPADVSLIRKPGRWGRMAYLFKVLRLLPKLRDYDVVQLINPVHFIDLKAERLDEVQRRPRCGTSACDISRILRNFGAMQYDIDVFHKFSPVFTSKRSKEPRTCAF